MKDIKKEAFFLPSRGPSIVIACLTRNAGAGGNLGFQEIYEFSKSIEINAGQGALGGSKETAHSIRENLKLIAEDLKKGDG